MDEEIDVKDYGFESAVEFVLYHWDKLPKESRERLMSIGIKPKKE